MFDKLLLIICLCFVINVYAEQTTATDISNAVLLEKLDANIQLTKMFMQQNEKRLVLMEKNMNARFEQVDKRIDMVFTLCTWGLGIVASFLICIGGVLIKSSSTLARVKNEIGALKRIERVEDTIEILIEAIKEFRPEFSLRKFKKHILTN